MNKIFRKMLPALIVFLLSGIAGYGQEIDKVLALIKFYDAKPQSTPRPLNTIKIALKKDGFQEQVEAIEKMSSRQLTAAEREELLMQIVYEKILEEAAIKANIKVTDAEVQAQLSQLKLMYAQQYNKSFNSDEDFKAFVNTQAKKDALGPNETAWDKLIEGIKSKKLAENYMMQTLFQAAAASKLTVTDDEINAKIVEFKKPYEQKLNRVISDEDLKSELAAANMNWDNFKAQIKSQISIEKYVEKNKIGNATSKPTDAEIENYYQKYMSTFIIPENVTVNQIFIDTANTSKEKKDACEKKINQIYTEISNKTKSFDDYLDIKINGETLKNSGFKSQKWYKNDPSLSPKFGSDFVDAVFKLDKGTITKVMRSNAGFHIIKIVEKNKYTLLTLDDKIPNTNETVRDAIAKAIGDLKKSQVFQKAAIEILITQLSKTKDGLLVNYTINNKNLTW